MGMYLITLTLFLLFLTGGFQVNQNAIKLSYLVISRVLDLKATATLLLKVAIYNY